MGLTRVLIRIATLRDSGMRVVAGEGRMTERRSVRRSPTVARIVIRVGKPRVTLETDGRTGPSLVCHLARVPSSQAETAPALPFPILCDRVIGRSILSRRVATATPR